MSNDGGARFWDLASEHLAAGACDEGTMMGIPCLRTKGEFVAMYWAKGGGMIVKLDAATVGRRVAEGRGSSFAPNGRVFREWLAVPDTDVDGWADVLAEAVAVACRR